MSFIKRLEKEIERLDKHIKKENMEIDKLIDKRENKKITGGDFSIKKGKIEDKIHAMNSRMRVLRGELAKYNRNISEKSEK